MEGRFKVGDIVRILPNAAIISGNLKVNDIVKVEEVSKSFIRDCEYCYKVEGSIFGFYENEIELAEDYILKQLWG